jgi:hypothetical protein
MTARRHRAALVTGGAQGIGKAIAARFVAGGWHVVIGDIDRVAGRETAAELGPRARFVHADVGEEEAVRRLVATAVRRHGGIDAMISNAGIGCGKPVTALTLAEWQRVIAVNLTAAFLAAKYAAPHLRARRGAILHLGSTRALMSEPNSEAYAATKGGLLALTHALALSLGPEVRVNCISPGWIATDAWRRRRDRREPVLSEADHRQHPVGRVGKPEDIADLAWYLCTQAGFITGQNLVCDGGMTRKMIYV